MLLGAPDQATTPSSAPARAATKAPATRRESQRAVMRRLHTTFGNDPERLVREYAAAERRGEARQKRNENDVTPQDYARALLADAAKKGWL